MPATRADEPARLVKAETPIRPASKAAREPSRIVFTRQIAPLVGKYCVKCHGGARPRAGFALDGIKTERQADSDRTTWEKVVRALQAHEMPPENKPQPTTADREPPAACSSLDSSSDRRGKSLRNLPPGR